MANPLVVVDVGSAQDEALRVDRDDGNRLAPRLGALGEHRGPDRAGDARPGGARPEEDEALRAPRRPERSAARMPARTTAAVPWMSSLKLGRRWR